MADENARIYNDVYFTLVTQKKNIRKLSWAVTAKGFTLLQMSSICVELN